ncbi:MAG TPA: hypothetical protein VFL86_20075, partial [Burkholderiaceae bacterium]|nr:hypothetical protein [Burkholderiaceae bacterium]
MAKPHLPIESAEELREALLKLHSEHDALVQASAHAQQLLDALDALLGMEPEDDPFDRVFASLRRVFSFAHALLLAQPAAEVGSDGALECLAADPPGPLGSCWPIGPLFTKVMNGRVVTTFSHAGVDEWRNAARLGLSPEQSALYVPLRVREQRGVLLLLSAPGSPGFDRGHVALARRFSVLASHALASRVASQAAAEGRRLRELTAQLRHSEQAARRNADLLKEVVNVLPLGLTVQDDAGRLVVVNDAAAAALGQAADTLRGQVLLARHGPAAADAAGATGTLQQLQHHREHLRSGSRHP